MDTIVPHVGLKTNQFISNSMTLSIIKKYIFTYRLQIGVLFLWIIQTLQFLNLNMVIKIPFIKLNIYHQRIWSYSHEQFTSSCFFYRRSYFFHKCSFLFWIQENFRGSVSFSGTSTSGAGFAALTGEPSFLSFCNTDTTKPRLQWYLQEPPQPFRRCLPNLVR